MVIDKSLKIQMKSSSKTFESMDMDVKENQDKSTSDTTLYNFGYAPKEVIEKFQLFCYQYSTLSDAIHSLLKRDRLLKYKYRFMTSSITYQMLARPTLYDKPHTVRSAMLSLHKYMKQGKYKSVADAIEELLFGFEDSEKKHDVGVNTVAQYNEVYEYTEVSAVEQEALAKIADALILKLCQVESKNSKKRPRKSNVNKKDTKSDNHITKQKQSVSPKSKSVSPLKDKTKTNSPVGQKLKLRKLFDDPEYFPTGSRKCLWSKIASDSPEESDNTGLSLSNSIIEHKVPPVDVELLTPMERLAVNYNTPCKMKSVIKHAVESGSNQSSKSMFMMQQLDLVSNDALDIILQTNSIVIDLTSDC